jgi:N-methylhydantoinase B
LNKVFDQLLSRSEQMTRSALRRIPEGKYYYEDFLDNDGVDLDRAIKLAVTVEVKNGEFVVDFTGTSAETRGPFNCVRSGVEAAAAIAIRMLTDERIPTNGGCFRPIKLILPEGSLVNPKDPAPVNARATPVKRLTSIIVCAFRDVLPDKVPADSASMSLVLMLSGKNRQGQTYVIGELIVAGSGASLHKDGIDVIDTDASNCMNMPVEALEMDAPLRVHRSELRRDSGGAGRTRGGLGIVREYELLDGEMRVTHRGERHIFAAKGAYGAGGGLCSRSILVRSDGVQTVLPSKTMFSLIAGERLICLTAGGGGYGPAEERPRAAVAEDVANGKVSVESAGVLYGAKPTVSVGAKVRSSL